MSFLHVGVTQAPSLNYGLIRAVCFPTAGSPHANTVLVVIIGPHAFESRIHKVDIEPPEVIKWLAGVHLYVLFLLQSYQRIQRLQLASLQRVMIL